MSESRITITHAFPIGGGWGYLCLECAAINRTVDGLCEVAEPFSGFCEGCFDIPVEESA